MLATAIRKEVLKRVKVPGLRRAREMRIMSQAELARLVGTSRPNITRLEHGQDARPSTVRRLAEALRVKPETLLERRGGGN